MLSMSTALVNLRNPQWRVLLIAAISLIPVSSGRSDPLTAEQQALVDKGAFMQMYKPDEHSRHFVAHIDAVTDAKTGKTRKMANNSRPVLCFVFGIEDAQPAREQGRSMAECHYTPSQAHEFLFAQGWDKYHDRFFTRCYVQEGEAAYEEVARAQRKHIDPASTG
jgi:hypothetical protein